MDNSWNNLPIILTVEDVALLMCVQPTTVRRWRRTGQIPSVKTGKKYLFDRSVIYNIIIGTTCLEKANKEG